MRVGHAYNCGGASGFTPSTCFLVLWLQALSFASTHTAPAPDLQPRYFSTKHEYRDSHLIIRTFHSSRRSHFHLTSFAKLHANLCWRILTLVLHHAQGQELLGSLAV
jgi:hypothetical protein